MAEKVTVEVDADKLIFTTRSNGDRILLYGFHLTPEDAAMLATMVNDSIPLTIVVKRKGD